jgi:hypothetical protein
VQESVREGKCIHEVGSRRGEVDQGQAVSRPEVVGSQSARAVEHYPCGLTEIISYRSALEASCNPSGSRWEVPMTCSDRNHPSCSYCWDWSCVLNCDIKR